MIIHSTKLSTQAMVINIYGGTTWISHSGYVLRGATSGVIANSAVKTGGSDDAIVVSHTHKVTFTSMAYTNGTNWFRAVGGDSTDSTSIQSSGSSGTNKNIPNYKSVYIWERIV